MKPPPMATRGLPPSVVAVLEFAATEVVPRLERTGDEVANLLAALEGRYVPAGPSGSPTRGLVNVLPTGRNFYSVDPKAIPSRNAWDVGAALAGSLIARHVADTGAYPRSVGLTVWGTSAMRTQGDDIAEVLALIGCRPAWDDASRRVTGFEIVPLAELGRPRIDVTVRISGFFRDAFPHVITLLDDAIAAVAGLDESAELNFVRAHADADLLAHGDRRRATTRIFGSKPGAYGAGLLPLIDARNWRTDADLAEVYAVWGGYAYGRGLDGREARADMQTAFARIAVAAKNTDTREHDIADSDDYFQFHGGMVAMVRHLTGSAPAAYIGDSAVPGPGAYPHPGRGDQAGVPGAGWSTRAGWPRWPGTGTRARSRWPRPWTTCSATTPRPAWWTTGCTSSLPPRTCSTRTRPRSCASRTRGRCAASPSGCSRPPTGACGPSRWTTPWTG